MNTKLIGAYGEQIAARYLRADKYNILAANFRAGTGEIDIIAEKGKIICFIEVKTRKEGGMFNPAEAVDYHKQNNLRSAASAYINRYKVKSETRFDIIEVLLSEENIYNVKSINHIKNAF